MLELCPKKKYSEERGGGQILPQHGHYVFQPPGGPIPAGQRCATCGWVYDRAKTKKVRVWSLHNRTCNMMRNPIILEVPVESTRARTTCFRPYHI